MLAELRVAVILSMWSWTPGHCGVLSITSDLPACQILLIAHVIVSGKKEIESRLFRSGFPNHPRRSQNLLHYWGFSLRSAPFSCSLHTKG
jgi:hypothetical protein